MGGRDNVPISIGSSSFLIGRVIVPKLIGLILRLYDVAIAALAINAPRKWVDNLLSHHDVPDVVIARRGIARRIPHSALLHLALARDLHVELGMSVRDALPLA